jgi:hypothetical protein
MTKAMEEARAIASAAAGQVHDNADARCVETLVEQLVATALSARDAEIDRLREIISQCADAIGNGAFVSPNCSLEFMSLLPGEIRRARTAGGQHG